jgi:dolichol-phosphate mannosyltransferase
MPEFKNKEKLITLFKFGLVGSSGIVVNSGVLWILHKELGISVTIASPVAIVIAVFNNFTWNNLFTWKERRDNYRYRYFHRLLKYYLSTSLGALINYGVLMFLFYLFDLNYLISNLAGIFVGMISNFILSDKWVFKSDDK